MISQKSCIENPHGGGWFSRELKLLPVFFGLIFSFNFSISDNTSALFVPTLSASIDQANLQVNGNQVINSADKTTEVPLNLIVDTNNKTGYTATLNSETNETALVNNDSSTNAKINSISADLPLNNLPNNTWGYKTSESSNYSPIPALSTPAQILQTAGKTYGNDTNSIKIGMKLSDNLESGRYTNKLIFSVLTNNYDRIAIMTEGPDFNAKLKSLETATNKIEHFKKSTIAPAASMNVINIEDEESDYGIKLWLDPTDKTAYYYAEPEKIYLNTDSGGMFHLGFGEQRTRNILDLDLFNFDTSNVTNMRSMFSDMPKLTSLNLSNFDTSKVTNMSQMFESMSSLTTLNLSSFDTSQVTDMSYMFCDMSKLTSLNLSNFDTSKVTDMHYMFCSMRSLTTLNLSNFDTSKVTDMNTMFFGMSKLTTLDLSSFDTSWVRNMYQMFCGMSSLTSLNLSSFDTSQVTNMKSMFYYAPNLTTLNLSKFNTSKVTDMSNMFAGMSSLTSLNLSNFDTSNVTNMRNMFSLFGIDKNKDNLEKIYVNNDFNTTKLTDFTGMFENRKKLRGGNGSYLTDPSTADKTWLRVDRPGVQGYFTRKP